LPAPGDPDPANVVERAEAEKLITDAIQALKPVYKEVFLLRQVEGLPVREVAEILDLPEGTVKTYLHRARAQLTDILTREGWV
jgi:RNA polymerase sigma-70 factor (ECF subfamily)